MADIIPFYKDTFLPSKLASLNEAISSDDEAAKALRQLKFTEGVINGRITVVEPEEDAKKRIRAKKTANRAMAGMRQSEKAVQKAEFSNFVKNLSKRSH